MPGEYIGETRSSAVYRFIGLLAFVLVLSWTTMAVAFAVATLYFIGDMIVSLILNRRMKFGKSFAYGFLLWHYYFLLWTFGFRNYPGHYPVADV